MRHHRKVTLCVVVWSWLVLMMGSAWGAAPAFEWSRRFDGPAHGPDEPVGVAVDGSGNVFVTGTFTRAGEKTGIATLKYDAEGKALWFKRSASAKPASVSALAVDGSGNAVVAGESDGEFLTIKYDGDGNELWSRRYRTGAGFNDVARAIAVSSDGSVFVAGDSTPPGGAPDYLVVLYDPEGEVVRTLRYDGPAGKADEVTAVGVDRGFGVSVTGRSQNESGTYELTTVKFNSSGVLSWEDRYAGKPDGSDVAESIAVDELRNIHVVGTSAGENGTDYVVMKIDDSGERLWVQRYDGASSGDDRARSLAVGPFGEVYVTGWSHDDSMGDLLTTLRYDAAGTPLWVSRYEGAAGGADRAAAVAVDVCGKVVVAGGVGPLGDAAAGFVTLGLDTSGQVLWTRTLNVGAGSDSRPVSLALDSATNVLLTGRSQRSGGSMDFLTAKYGRAPVWETETVSRFESGEPSMAVDGLGRLHLCYVEIPEEYVTVLRYATFDGSRWVKKIVVPDSTRGHAMAVDSRNRPVVCYVDDALKCATFDGAEWLETAVEAEPVTSVSVAVDAGDNPHVTYIKPIPNSSNGDLFHARYDESQWIKENITEAAGNKVLQYGGTSLALTAEGNAHITVSADGATPQLYWVNNISGAWRGAQIAEGGEPSLTLDSEGNPHVVYEESGDRRPGYARYTGSRWIVTDLFDALGIAEGSLASGASIHRDGGGVVHVVFEANRDYLDRLVHAYKVKTGWAYDVVSTRLGGARMTGRGDDIYIGFRSRSDDDGVDYNLKLSHRRTNP